MKIPLLAASILATSPSGTSAFISPKGFGITSSAQQRSTTLSMVLEAPKDKTLSKIEVLKTKSNHLTDPLKEVSAERYLSTVLEGMNYFENIF